VVQPTPIPFNKGCWFDDHERASTVKKLAEETIMSRKTVVVRFA
jgi:hypothetical protein